MRRNVLLWHVHGSWTQAFVAGRHRYLLPVTGDSDGLGLAGRSWPSAREVPFYGLPDTDIDLVVLQRPEEIDLAARWMHRRPGVDVPAVYVEHNAPHPYAECSRHPLAGRRDIVVVHVTEFNRLMWDTGIAPTRVIDHGIDDPGFRFTGELPAVATMINEPVRRGRTVGTDLLAPLSAYAPIDLWGTGSHDVAASGRVTAHGDVAPPELWNDVARRRVYVHTARWTSLGHSLLEAMFLGMPVVAVAATMAPLAIPGEAGVVSADTAALGRAIEEFLVDHAAAAAAGKAAREFATARFGLERFLHDWDVLIEELCA